MKIYKTIIVEDNPLNAIILKSILKDNYADIDVLAVATTIATAREALSVHKPEIVLMDIELSSGTTFDILSDLHQKDVIDFEIIFITAHEEYDYIIKAIDYSALAFLIKPINPELLRGAIEKAKTKQSQKMQMEQLLTQLQERHKPNTKIIVPTTDHKKEAVVVSDITYIQADRLSSVIHFIDGSSLTVGSILGQFKKTLMSDHAFFLIHNSILVNVEQIQSFRARDYEITLNNGEKLCPSRRLGKDFKKYWTEFVQNKNKPSFNIKDILK